MATPNGSSRKKKKKTRRGLLADLECPAEIWWGQITDTAGGSETRDEMVEDKKTTDLPAVRE